MCCLWEFFFWLVFFLGLASLGLPSLCLTYIFFVFSTTPAIGTLSFIACINQSCSSSFLPICNSLRDLSPPFKSFTFIFLIVASEISTDADSKFFAASASFSGSVVATYFILKQLIHIVNFSCDIFHLYLHKKAPPHTLLSSKLL